MVEEDEICGVVRRHKRPAHRKGDELNFDDFVSFIFRPKPEIILEERLYSVLVSVLLDSPNHNKDKVTRVSRLHAKKTFGSLPPEI